MVLNAKHEVPGSRPSMMEKMRVEHFQRTLILYLPFQLPYFDTLCKFATRGTRPRVHDIKSSTGYSLSIAPDSRSLRRAEKNSLVSPILGPPSLCTRT